MAWDPFVVAVDVVDVELRGCRPLYVGLEQTAVVLDVAAPDGEAFAPKRRHAPTDTSCRCSVRHSPDSVPAGRRGLPLPRGQRACTPAVFLDQEDVALGSQSLI